jgi:hypothetical protein
MVTAIIGRRLFGFICSRISQITSSKRLQPMSFKLFIEVLRTGLGCGEPTEPISSLNRGRRRWRWRRLRPGPPRRSPSW